MPSKEVREEYIKRGICPNCGNRPPTKGYSVCGECSIRSNRNSKNYYMINAEKYRAVSAKRVAKNKREGKCSCGNSLHPEADAGCVSCINCRERANK